MSDLGRFHTQLSITHTSRTRSRDKIYVALWRNGPITSQQLIDHLESKVNRVTIYRSIEKFLEIGVIAEINPGTYELTDKFTQHHHYFVCRKCAKRTALNDEATEKALTRLATRRKLILEEHTLELSGLCGLCADKPGENPNQPIGTDLRRPMYR